MFVIFIVWDSFGKQGQEVLSHPNPHVIVSAKNECNRTIGKYSMSAFERFQARHCKKASVCTSIFRYTNNKLVH